MRTKYLPVEYRFLVIGKYPSAGPNPCIRGMKKKYYGLDSYCVMCDKYLYNLGQKLTAETQRIYALAK